VEGAEYDVLAGAKATLVKHRPVIFLSLHPKHLELLGRKADELPDIVKEMSYKCTNIDGSEIREFALQEYLLSPLE